MISAEKAFLHVEWAIQLLLDAGKFLRGEMQQHPEAFGSRYAIYRSDNAGLRLTWDGKEQYSVLECDRLANEATAVIWIDLTLQRFDPAKADGRWLDEVCEDIFAALREYMVQWDDATKLPYKPVNSQKASGNRRQRY